MTSNLEQEVFASKSPVKLESFCYYKGISVRNRFGIAGFGGFGNKIANLFASLTDDNGRPYYPTVAFNSFTGDFEHLKYIPKDRKFGFKGVEDGCGRTPQLAKKAIVKHKSNQEMFHTAYTKFLKDCDIFIAAAGFGGGTGTGTALMGIKAFQSFINEPLIENGHDPITIGAIITLPSSSAPVIEKYNAIQELKHLEELMNSKEIPFKFIIIVDNEKAYQDYKLLKASGNTDFEDWMDYSNHNIVQIIHEMNLATNFNSDRAFDPRNFKNIFEKNIGCITFGKYKFPLSDIKNDKELVEHTITALHDKNVFANGFNFKKTRHAGVLFVKPGAKKGSKGIITKDSLDEVDVGLHREMPLSLFRYSGFIDWEKKDEAIIYCVAKIEEYPKRAKEELQAEYNDVMKEIQEDVENTSFKTNIKGINGDIFTESKTSKKSINPFGDFDGESSSTKKSKKPADPFILE